MKTTFYRLRMPVRAPLKIALVADLHNRPCGAVLEQLAKEQPDLIAVPGDLMVSAAASKNSMEFLRRATAMAPVFYAPGNHEQLTKDDLAEIRATGTHFLDNQAEEFGGLQIGGLSSGFGRQRQGNFKATPPPDLDFLSRFAALPEPKLLLCHHPEYYLPYLQKLPIALILSGHAHGGQWRLFGRGLFAPGQGFFPAYTGGVYEQRLVVSRGLANTAFLPRLLNPTELVFVLLQP